MTRGETLELQPHLSRQRRKRSKFDVAVAADTGIRCPCRLIFTAEILNHHFLIFAGNIHDPERDSDPLRHLGRTLDILFLIRTVTTFPGSATKRVVLIPDPHDRSGNLMSGLLQEHGGNRGIHASAQPDQNLHFTIPPVN